MKLSLLFVSALLLAACGAPPSARERWNTAYTHGAIFRPQPNDLLAVTVKEATPGRALDLMMGQGRNAVFLAQAGWKVTGVDVSDEALRLAEAAAKRAEVPLVAVRADVDSWDLGRERWDLVVMVYAGSDPALIDRAKAAVAPGGLFVFETFGVEQGELARHFDRGFTVIRDDVVDADADWGPRAPVAHFVARRN